MLFTGAKHSMFIPACSRSRNQTKWPNGIEMTHNSNSHRFSSWVRPKIFLFIGIHHACRTHGNTTPSATCYDTNTDTTRQYRCIAIADSFSSALAVAASERDVLCVFVLEHDWKWTCAEVRESTCSRRPITIAATRRTGNTYAG